MDPDSPFASLGGGSVKEPPQIGFRYTGKMVCLGKPEDAGCGHEWNVPMAQAGPVVSGCPKCHRTTGLILKDGSVQEAPPPRK
jgi:hypothetical protein